MNRGNRLLAVPTYFVIITAFLLATIVAMVMQPASGGVQGPARIEANLQSHNDGDGPPICRPASKYAGDPRPSDAECKHKPEKL